MRSNVGEGGEKKSKHEQKEKRILTKLNWFPLQISSSKRIDVN